MASLEFERSVREAMLSSGMSVPDALNLSILNKYQRFNPETGSHKKGSLKGWYRLSQTKKGQFVVNFGDFSNPYSNGYVIEKAGFNEAGYRKLTQEEVQERQRQLQEAERQEQNERALAQQKLQHFSKNLIEIKQHPYLTEKGFSSQEQATFSLFGSKKGGLAIPIFDAMTHKLINMQFIFSGLDDQKNVISTKRFIKSCEKENGYYLITPPGQSIRHRFKKGAFIHNEVVGFVEGFATGLEVMRLLEIPVVVTFDSGNMKKVVDSFLKNDCVLQKNMLIVADNDWFKAMSKPHIGNTGINTAKLISDSYNIPYIHPSFTSLGFPSENIAHCNDFNDLTALVGIKPSRQQALDKLSDIVAQRYHNAQNMEHDIINEIKMAVEKEKGSTPHAFYYCLNHFIESNHPLQQPMQSKKQVSTESPLKNSTKGQGISIPKTEDTPVVHDNGYWEQVEKDALGM